MTSGALGETFDISPCAGAASTEANSSAVSLFIVSNTDMLVKTTFVA